MTYELGKSYSIYPWGKTIKESTAEFIGYLRIKEKNQYPVFMW